MREDRKQGHQKLVDVAGRAFVEHDRVVVVAAAGLAVAPAAAVVVVPVADQAVAVYPVEREFVVEEGLEDGHCCPVVVAVAVPGSALLEFAEDGAGVVGAS